MALVLSNELLERNLFNAEDANFVSTAPKGVSEEFFDKFLLVLKAESVDECNDVSTDELIKMLECGDELFKELSFGTVFNEYLMQKLTAEKSQLAKRRVI